MRTRNEALKCDYTLFKTGFLQSKTSINTLTQQNFQKMGDALPAGGPTQDEVMAISLFKMGLRSEDTLLDLGCGTGKVSIAAAGLVQKVYAVDRRPEAISYAKNAARAAAGPISNFFPGKQQISSQPLRSSTAHSWADRSRSKRSCRSFPAKSGGSLSSMRFWWTRLRP